MKRAKSCRLDSDEQSATDAMDQKLSERFGALTIPKPEIGTHPKVCHQERLVRLRIGWLRWMFSTSTVASSTDIPTGSRDPADRHSVDGLTGEIEADD
jgi:hypothetical protein